MHCKFLVDKIYLKKMLMDIVHNIYTKSTILKYLKIQLDSDLKIILLDYQNNYVGWSNIMSNKKFRHCNSQLEHPTQLF